MLKYIGVSAFTYAVLLTLCNGLSRRDECTSVSLAYEDLGFPAIDVPRGARQGKDLQICGKGISCCTREMEGNLDTLSRREFARSLANKTEFTRTSFITATAQFNDFFLNLLKTAHSELDTMFNSAYGLMYQQNKDIFNQLFADFQRYYKGGNISLNEAMNTFFTAAFTRMFVMQSPEYSYDEKYMLCIGSKLHELKPFGTIPEKLTKNVRQAFVAARTFVQGLAVGRNVALKMAQVQATEYCGYSYTNQSYCSLCEGFTKLKPCDSYCLNVMKGCLAYHAEVASSWEKYINAIEDLAERLAGSGTFSIEVVMTPLKDMISECIMEYHSSNVETVSDQIFSKKLCGIPPLISIRGKRAAKSEKKQHLESRRSRLESQKSRPESLMSKQGSLFRLVSDIRAKIVKVRNIWTDLPHSMCGKAETERSPVCWNGVESGRYKESIAGDGLVANAHNPEVFVSVNQDNPIITEQIEELKMAAKHLGNAKQGIDVDWLDFDFSTLPVSNSVSSGNQMGGSKDTEPVRHSTQIPPKNTNLNGDEDIDVSGSGASGPTEPLDNLPDDSGPTETLDNLPDDSGNDDDEDVVYGSGGPAVFFGNDNSPKVTKENEEKNDIDIVEGSGTVYDSNPPFAIPIIPTRKSPNRGNNVQSGGKPFTVEGSGSFSVITSDDEDYYIPIDKGHEQTRGENNIIQEAVTQKKLYVDMTTPNSASSVASANHILIVLGLVIFIGVLDGEGVS